MKISKNDILFFVRKSNEGNMDIVATMLLLSKIRIIGFDIEILNLLCKLFVLKNN
jgi:hypothetical protein